jgi:hypothetical protein
MWELLPDFTIVTLVALENKELSGIAKMPTHC